jgi:hypothetical protein
MTEKRDMFSSFRERSKELRIQPRPQLWERLEGRLQRHRGQTRVLRIRNLVVAATLAMLTVSSVLLLLKLNQIQQKLAAARGFQVAELPYPESASGSAPAQVVNLAPAEVPEGHPHKRLFVKAAGRPAGLGMAWFAWMEGAWENPHQKGMQETWTAGPDGDLQGSLAYAAPASLRIRQDAEGNISFRMTLEEGAPPVTYALHYQDQHQVIFENPEIDFPRQVVIQRLGPNHLGFIYRNAQLEGLSAEQAAYLARHHQVQAQQISRQLFRIADQPM